MKPNKNHRKRDNTISFEFARNFVVWVRYCLQISLETLKELKQINSFLFPLKSWESLWLYDDFRHSRS